MATSRRQPGAPRNHFYGAREFHLLLFLLLVFTLLTLGRSRLLRGFGRFSLPGILCHRIRFHGDYVLSCRIFVPSLFCRGFGGLTRTFRAHGQFLRNAFRGDFFAFYGSSHGFTRLQAGEIIIDGQTDFFHRLGANSFDGLQLLGSHVRQGLDRSHTGGAQLLDEPFTQAGHTFQRSGSGTHQRGHLQFHFLPLLFLALNVDLPAQQLRCQPDVLSLLTDGKGKLAVIHHNFEMLVARIHYGHTAHFGWLQRLFREGHRIFVILNDVNLLAAQLADNGLHPHTLHADASAHRVHVFVLGHDRDLGALSGFARNRPDHHGSIINFRNFGLEQVLHQIRRSPRNHDRRSFR